MSDAPESPQEGAAGGATRTIVSAVILVAVLIGAVFAFMNMRAKTQKMKEVQTLPAQQPQKESGLPNLGALGGMRGASEEAAPAEEAPAEAAPAEEAPAEAAPAEEAAPAADPFEG